MNIRFTFLLITAILLLNLPAKAQKTTSNGPKTEIGDRSRILVFGEDESNLYIFSSDLNVSWGDYDDSNISIYDKNKHTLVSEFELDDDYDALTAYLDGNNVVIINGKYNKKTKCVEYGKCVVPVNGKTPKKFVFTPSVSVPTNGLEVENICAFLSIDRTKLAFATYTHPKKNDKEYVLDVRICDIDGTEISHVNEHIDISCPDRVKGGYLTPNGTLYLDEDVRTPSDVKFAIGGYDGRGKWTKHYTCITSSGEVVLCKVELEEGAIYNPYSIVLPNQHLFFAGICKKGLVTMEIDGNGEGEPVLHEMDILKRPESIHYEDKTMKNDDFDFIPNQILPLSNGNRLIVAHQYKSVMGTTANGHIYIDHFHRNIHLFMLDKNGELTASNTLPNVNINDNSPHKDIPCVFELNNEVYLVYNENKSNLASPSNKTWKTLQYNKGSQECVVAGKLDSDLHFTPEIIYKPKSTKDFNNFEHFDQIINVSNDAIYYILHRDGDNHIEVLTEN